MNLERWAADLDRRCEESTSGDIPPSSFRIPLIRPKKLEWKIGEEGADDVVLKNVRMMDGIFAMRMKRCGNQFCRYPISALRLDTYATPEWGDVCATCHDLYSAITMSNNHLTNKNYFRDRHHEWKREVDEAAKKKRKFMDGGFLNGGSA